MKKKTDHKKNRLTVTTEKVRKLVDDPNLTNDQLKDVAGGSGIYVCNTTSLNN